MAETELWRGESIKTSALSHQVNRSIIDEFHKFGWCRPDRNDFGGMGFGSLNSSSRRIYLTFQAYGTFKEEDFLNYFRYVWTGSRCEDSVSAKTDVWVCHIDASPLSLGVDGPSVMKRICGIRLVVTNSDVGQVFDGYKMIESHR